MKDKPWALNFYVSAYHHVSVFISNSFGGIFQSCISNSTMSSWFSTGTSVQPSLKEATITTDDRRSAHHARGSACGWWIHLLSGRLVVGNCYSKYMTHAASCVNLYIKDYDILRRPGLIGQPVSKMSNFGHMRKIYMILRIKWQMDGFRHIILGSEDPLISRSRLHRGQLRSRPSRNPPVRHPNVWRCILTCRINHTQMLFIKENIIYLNKKLRMNIHILMYLQIIP